MRNDVNKYLEVSEFTEGSYKPFLQKEKDEGQGIHVFDGDIIEGEYWKVEQSSNKTVAQRIIMKEGIAAEYILERIEIRHHQLKYRI